MRIPVLTVLFLSLMGLNAVFGEQVTLTTYYPAPFGSYDRLRLVPRDILEKECVAGTLYVDNGPKLLHYCRGRMGKSPKKKELPGEWGSFVFTDTFIITVSGLRDEIGLVKKQIGLMRGEMDRLKDETKDSFKKLERRIDNLGEDLKKNCQVINDLKKEVAQLRRSLHNH